MQPYLLELYGDPHAYLIAGLSAAIVAGAQMLGGVLAVRIRGLFGHRVSALIAMAGGSAITIGVLALAASFWAVVGLAVVWALLFSATMPIRQAFLNDMIPSQQRATILSFDSLMSSAGGVWGQPVLGRAADAWGYAPTYAVSAGIAALASRPRPIAAMDRARRGPGDERRARAAAGVRHACPNRGSGCDVLSRPPIWAAHVDRRHHMSVHEKEPNMDMPPIVSPSEWEAARAQLLVKEKELTRARDALAAQRRRMPRMAVEKDYRFEGPDGPASLLDLFAGRRQLIVYRFFFEPGVAGWPESGCHGCSMVADQVAHLAHLNARDTTLVFVSRAPQADIERWKARMGWQIPWYTLTDDFDADFGVDQLHGTNAFLHDGDQLFRTYFINSRGDEAMGSTWSYLDITALGRQEKWEASPDGYPQTSPYQWWNLHDEYDEPTVFEDALSEAGASQRGSRST